MTAYEQIWPVAEEHYGIITSAQAKELGVSNNPTPPNPSLRGNPGEENFG